MEIKSGIYCIENLINGMKYIGKGKNVHQRMSHRHRGSTYLFNALSKHGEENFSRYIIEYCEVEKTSEREIYYIKEWNTKSPNGYNLTDGGEGIINPSEEVRAKFSKFQKGKIVSKETCAKMSESKKGHDCSEETRQKMSESHSGENNPMFGKNSPFSGKKHTEESRRKMSESQKNYRRNKNTNV